MEKLKSSLTNMTLMLVVFSVVIGVVLALVNNVTANPISEQAEKKLADGIKEVLCSDDLTVTANDTIVQEVEGKQLAFIVHKASDKSGKSLGAAVESTTTGFGGDLQVLVGFSEQGNVLGYTILQSAETPGLGAKADKWFQKDGKGNIIGKSMSDGELTVSKDGGSVDAITASTITSRAFLKAVNQAYSVYSKQAIDGESGASKQAKKGDWK